MSSWRYPRYSDMQDQSLLDPATSFRHHQDLDMYNARRYWRTVSKKSLWLIFGCFCFVTIMYVIFSKPGVNLSRFNIYKLTQNVYFNKKDGISTTGENISRDDYFCIVFDAGSTGTRIHIFHFKKTKGGLKIIIQVFKVLLCQDIPCYLHENQLWKWFSTRTVKSGCLLGCSQLIIAKFDFGLP